LYLLPMAHCGMKHITNPRILSPVADTVANPLRFKGQFPELGALRHHLLPLCTFSFVIAYLALLAFVVPKAITVGRRHQIVSGLHRWSGIISLVLPMALMAYESLYERHPHIVLYALCVLNLSLNCIFGALLIPKRVPKWDVPTIRIFVVAATGGLSFVSLSINFRFGHLPSFESMSRMLAVLSLISVAYAFLDLRHHVRQFVVNLKEGTATNCIFQFTPKQPLAFALGPQRPTLWYCFFPSFFHRPSDAEASATSVPSNVAVLGINAMTAFFGGLTGFLQIHCLLRGHRGMQYLRDTFPRTTQMAVYGFLGAALANNFAAFAGTLVLKRKMSIFKAAMVNLVAALVPIVEVLVFIARYGDEERVDEFMWNTFSCRCPTC